MSCTSLNRLLIAVVILAGCPSVDKLSASDSAPLPTEADADTDTDTDSDTDTDTDPPAPCEARVTGITPADGTAAVYADAVVVVTFDAPADAAGLTLDPATPGVSTLATDGRSASFVPDAPLARATTYTATATVCDDTAVARFTTVGDPVGVDLTLSTWDVALTDDSDLRWLSPALGPTLASRLDTPHLLWMVESRSGSSIHFISAAGVDDRGGVAQYPCAQAVDFPVADFAADPGFTAGPAYAELALGGVLLPVWDLVLSGEVAGDASALHTVRISGQIDLAPLTPLLGQDPCELAAFYGDACVACPTGAATCVDLLVEDERAERLDGFVVDPYVTPGAECG